MAKVRTTVTLDEDGLGSAKVLAARSGKGDSEIIEQVLRRELGLDLLDALWERADMQEDDAAALALEAQRWARRR